MVRPQPRRRGNRVARGRRGRGHRRRGDELLQDPRSSGVETRLAIPVNVATDARYRGQGVFSTLRAGERGGGRRLGVSAHRHLSEREVVPDLHPPARLDRPAAAAPLGATAAGRRASSGTRFGRPGERGGMRAPTSTPRRCDGLEVRPSSGSAPRWTSSGARAAAGYGSHFVRDAEYFNWRYLDSPRDYRCFGAYRGDELAGVAVVGHTFKHGVSAGFRRRPRRRARRHAAVRALVSRAADEVKGGADALVLLPPRSRAHRRALAAGRLRADEQEAPLHRQAAPRRRPHRRARRRVALHAGRLRLLLR